MKKKNTILLILVLALFLVLGIALFVGFADSVGGDHHRFHADAGFHFACPPLPVSCAGHSVRNASGAGYGWGIPHPGQRYMTFQGQCSPAHAGKAHRPSG